jgi:hypothetical protein
MKSSATSSFDVAVNLPFDIEAPLPFDVEPAFLPFDAPTFYLSSDEAAPLLLLLGMKISSPSSLSSNQG